MRDAIENDVSEQDFDAQVRRSNWFVSRSDSARKWDTETLRDPAQAERRRQMRTRTWVQSASSFGIQLDQTDLRQLTEDSLRWDYTQDEMNAFILSRGVPGEIKGGSISVDANEITKIARGYLVGIDKRTAQEYAMKVGRGEMTVDGVKSLYREQALQSFPQFSNQIQNGFSILDATSGIRDQVSKTLGISANQIDFNDDRWTDLIDKVDSKGNRRMMTRAEAGRWARTQDGYRTTDQANNLARNVVSMIGKSLGKVK